MTYQSALETLKTQNLYRRLYAVHSAQGPRIIIDGRELLNFSSNDYLGLAHSPDLIRMAAEALQEWGTGSGASRHVSGSLNIHHKLEKSIASFKREERGLLFSSGFLANMGVIPALAGKGDTIWIDRFCHASIVDAARASGAALKVYPHRNLERLDRGLRRRAKGRVLIVTDSYFSMDGDRVNLNELLKLARQHGAQLMVDEAHATGIWGPTGRGLTEEYGVEGRVDVVMGTFSKAFGSHGGFVAGRGELIDYLVNRARTLIYTTAPAPATSAASLEAIRIAAEGKLLATLRQNVLLLRTRLLEAGFDLMDSEGPIVPICLGDRLGALNFSQKLFEKNIWIPAIRPPTVPKGADRLRMTVTAGHRTADIEHAVKVLEKVRP